MKGVERIKNAIIVVLAASLIVLVILALPGGEQTAREKLRSLAAIVGILPTDVDHAASVSGMAAQPNLISLRTDAGRVTVQRNATALDQAYAAVASLYGRALSTASEGRVASQKEFLTALGGSGLYLAFPDAIPAEAFASWLGAENSALTQTTAEGYLLQPTNNATALWLYGDSITVFQTELAASTVLAAIGDNAPDGSAFAFEIENTQVDPMTLWEDEQIILPGIQIENAVTQAVAQSIAAALEFNPYGAGAYTDIDGAFVFSESGRSCTVAGDGTVHVSAEEGKYAAFSAEAETPVQYIDAASRALQQICQDRLGEARLCLTQFEKTKTGAECRFAIMFSGIPISPLEATVVFTDTQLTELTVPLRTFTQTDEHVVPMPLAPTTALAPDGARLVLGYILNENGALGAGWRVR